MPKTLKQHSEELKSMMDMPEVDVSVKKAKMSAEDMKRQMLAAEYKQRMADGEPVGSKEEFINSRLHGAKDASY